MKTPIWSLALGVFVLALHSSRAMAGSCATCSASGGEPLPSAVQPSAGRFSLPTRLPGMNGIPSVAWNGSGLNSIWTAGPTVHANVNGIGGDGSVFLGTGGASWDANDFYLPLNGINWWHRRMYTSLNTSGLNWQGEKWWGNEMMNISVAGSDGTTDVTWTVDPNYNFVFTYNSGSGTYNLPSDNYPLTISFVSGSDEYQISREDGWTWVFHDGAHTNSGKLKRIEDPYDNDWAFTYSSGQLTDIVVDVIAGNDHKITYTYFTSGDNNGKVQYIKVYKTTTTTDANLIGKLEYIYHDSASDDYGTTGDLMKAIVSRKGTTDGDGTLSIEETYRYRYYKGTYNSSTNPGTDHQLKFILNPENGDRFSTPESQTNTTWLQYVNVAYEYDSNGRVRKTDEQLPGTGCGCGGASAGTTDYTWSVNTTSGIDVDTWKLHCVADREDNSRVIFDVNRVYNILTWVVQDEDDGTPTKELIWHFDYGTSGSSENRLIAIHYPSACSDYDESSPYAATLRSTSGMIHTIEYASSQTGYPEKIRVKKGTSGTPDTSIQYARGVSERPDLATTITHYESGSEADGRATTLTYTFYDGAKEQPKQIDTTHPSVSAGKNGPDASAVTKEFFDKRTGDVRWTIDGEGYVMFHAYDDETGVEDLIVTDANTSSLMTVIDDNWDGVAHGGLSTDDTVPFSRSGSGTALNIDSSAVIDWLGRTRKTTEAGGMITYHVYKDDETRTYPAWNTSTYLTLLPAEIVKTDKEGRMEDTLQLKITVTPSKDGSNEPTGAETYANSDLVSRVVSTYNLSAALQTQKRYHWFPASGDGTRYTNYYQTDYEYDSMGRLEYTIADVSDESTYDREQVTRTYYDFVGRTIKTEEGVSSNTHDISSGKPTLNKTAEFFFDDPDADATPEQGTGDGNLSWVRRWHGTGASDYNDTNYRYDWRNRQQLVIPPTSPYTLVKHDNLDRVTSVGTYSATTNLDPGDDPATTENTIRLSLSKSYFDEWGRVYKTETYDDPADATPADALTANNYYDRRGLVWASDPPNTGISFTEYDGAGRTTASMQGTQFDTTKYTSSAPNYPDADEGLVQIADYTLDEDGNVQRILTKEINHDDTDGLKLIATDGVKSWVYHYYDAAHRLTDTANFGTNTTSWKYQLSAPAYDQDGGTAGDQPPTRSDTILVTSYTYEQYMLDTDAYVPQGRYETVTDPKGIVTRTVYDWAGRTILKIEDQGTSLLNRKTEYQYNGQDSLARIVADLGGDNTYAGGSWTMAGSDTDQVTEYAYTDGQNARWVKEIRYPTGDGTVGSTQADKIVFLYNADGTLATRTDQNGTLLTWSYDALRRKTEEEAATLGSYSLGATAVDGAVRSLTWTYDSDGHVERATSHTDTTPDTSGWTDAANQVKYTFNAAGQMTKEEQEYDGAVDGSTLSVQYAYGTEYTSSGNYNRRNNITYPDSRKIWYGYTHSGGANTFQDTINDKFSRVGQIAKDNSGSIGNILAEYDFNGLGRMVRRVHDEDTGKYGNDTRMDLWHGTSGQYDGLDRFGRIVDMKHTDFSGSATDFLRRKYGYDCNGNRTYIDHVLYKADSQSFTYDNLNRLTDADRGILNSSNQVHASDISENLNMDLLGNFTPTAGGLKINATTSTITHAVNATNEITTLDRPNAAGASIIINEPFTTTLNSYWSANKGTWSISSDKVNVDTLTSGDAVLLASPSLDTVNFELTVTFPTSSSTNKAGLVFAHDGTNTYHAVVLNRSTGKIALYKITSGSWGSVLASANATINDSTAYTIKVAWKQALVEASVVGQSTAAFGYESSTDLGDGQAGLYSDKTGVTFDDFKAYLATAKDPKAVPGVGGLAQASLSASSLLVQADPATFVGGEVEVERFWGSEYIVQATVDLNSGAQAYIWVNYKDPNNGYRIKLDSSGGTNVSRVQNGKVTVLASETYTTSSAAAVRIRVDTATDVPRVRVWIDGTLELNTTDTAHWAGGVAFSGEKPKFSYAKIGFDGSNPPDNDISDSEDNLVWEPSFGSTSTTVSHDHAGNLIDDGTFRYVYDAWNRLVKVQASVDNGAVTYQTSEFDALGRKIYEVVDVSGDLNGNTIFLYNGQQIIETRWSSGTVVQQFIHGTQYIDELVMMRRRDKGDLYIHQDANWNVIGVTDLGHHLVERSTYTPYGELTVDQETGYGDRDGDGDVDSTDKGTVGTTCTGTVSGSCRILDLDFDGDYDSTDATKFDALTQGAMRSPGRRLSAVEQPFAHQGLLFEPEIASYQNRARQYDPPKRRFAQRDPIDGSPNAYEYVLGNPLLNRDPSGKTVGGGDGVSLTPGNPGCIARCRGAFERCNTSAVKRRRACFNQGYGGCLLICCFRFPVDPDDFCRNSACMDACVILVTLDCRLGFEIMFRACARSYSACIDGCKPEDL